MLLENERICKALLIKQYEKRKYTYSKGSGNKLKNDEKKDTRVL